MTACVLTQKGVLVRMSLSRSGLCGPGASIPSRRTAIASALVPLAPTKLSVPGLVTWPVPIFTMQGLLVVVQFAFTKTPNNRSLRSSMGLSASVMEPIIVSLAVDSFLSRVRGFFDEPVVNLAKALMIL